jgi:Ca-activated chloride channel homolog
MPSPSFTLNTDRKLVPAGKTSTRYLVVRVTAPAASSREERLPVNISLVLDRSGSMGDERKFVLARQAVDQALHMLRARDCFSVVVYDDRIDVITQSTLATEAAKRRAMEGLDEIEPRGATDLCSGWLRGCEQVANHLVREDTVSRCLLLTDGLANRGIQNRDELAVHAAELQRRGVATSTFGVGADFDERLLRDMAHEGGGNFYFIDGAAQIPRILTSELGEAIEVTVRGAVVELTLPRGVDAELLSRFRTRRALGDNELRIELGDLVSEQEILLVIKLTIPAGEIGSSTSVGVTATARGAVETTAELRWTYANDADDEAQERDRGVDRDVARLEAARARADALEANRVGDFTAAQQRLGTAFTRIMARAQGDAVQLQMAQALQNEASEYVRTLAPQTRQAKFFEADTVVRSRDLLGQVFKKRGP